MVNAANELQIPAHSYQLSFESNPDWSQFYATAPEILQYWRTVADKYDVRKYMKFKHKCKEARWDDTTAKWHVTFDVLDEVDGVVETITDVGDVFMTGIGALNEWRWPNIPGLNSFEGRILHSANYDNSFDVVVSVKCGRTLGLLANNSRIKPSR